MPGNVIMETEQEVGKMLPGDTFPIFFKIRQRYSRKGKTTAKE